MACIAGGVAHNAHFNAKRKQACGPTGSPARETMSLRPPTKTSGVAPAKTYAKSGRGR